MSFLLPCPHCGQRDVQEFVCAGEVTTRPKETPTLRGADRVPLLPAQRRRRAARVVVPPLRLRALVPGRARHADERRPRCADVEAGRGVRLPPRPGRADRPRRSRSPSRSEESPVAGARSATRSARRCTPRAGASSRAASSTTGRAGSSAAPASCPNCLMEVDGVPNVRVCVEPVREGASCARAERPRLARARPARRRRPVRRAVHAGRLLLPDDDPAAAGLAGLRAVPAERRRPRPDRQARRAHGSLRHRAPRTSTCSSSAAVRPASTRRGLPPGTATASCSSTTGSAATRRPPTRLRRARTGPAPSASTRAGSSRSTQATCSTGCGRAGSWSRPGRSSSRSCSRATTSWASCSRARSGGSSPTGRSSPASARS